MYAFCIGEIKELIHPVWNLSTDWSLFSLFHGLTTENKQRTLAMYNIAYKLIIGRNFDFNNVVIFIWQILIECFDKN